ncbi:MAG: hypothetical protein JRH07_07150 [Deltaproteobacteria bacterium]|nr:hypothetical protein [Deltaproteobacteria bacterium]MBW2121607.1 hypothetical protein [Deltaproteobacteria bacterium]
MKQHFDFGSLIVIAVTFILFAIALFTKGLTHDILLEAAIFLVSLKLIIMSYKNVDLAEPLQRNLDSIQEVVRRIESQDRKNRAE